MGKRFDEQVDIILDEAEDKRMCFTAYNDASRKDLKRRLKEGSVVSPLPGLYTRPAYWEQLDEREQALHKIRGLQQIHQLWIFCGATAALAQGLSVSRNLYEPYTIADEHGTRDLLGGVVLTRHTTGDRPVFIDGISCTPLLRTLFDCARWLSLREATVVLDSALRQGLVTKEEMITDFESRKAGYRGVKKAIAAARFADGRAQNGGESVARAAMWELGFRTPDLQTEICEPLDGKKYYLDFSWRLPDGTLIAGELDGAQKYTDPQMAGNGGIVDAMRRERIRESRLTACCDAVVRFSMKTVGSAYEFNRLLTSFGIPKDHRPTIKIPSLPAYLRDPKPTCAPDEFERVPLEAYGI